MGCLGFIELTRTKDIKANKKRTVFIDGSI
jgi:hypothetical protein